jgi:multidrug efflux system membrane fusion protein
VAVKLGLANEAGYSRLGKVFFVDNQLSESSGTIRVRAIFDNADGALLPGLYARVAVDGGPPHRAILVDERAISTDQAKKFVLILDQSNHAQYREIKPGYPHDGYREVDAGLSPGDRIVVNGMQLIHPGDEVKVHEVPMAGELGQADISQAQ